MNMFQEVRSKFLAFFQKKGHLITASASLLPDNDKSILFINSGMAPMKGYFLNESIPPSKTITNSQQCLRVGGKHNDLSQIGYTKRHHTFFEMLGNFSFGAYFKEDAINLAWEFLTKEINLDKSRLYVTIHPKDEEALNFWKKHVEVERIIKLEANVWTMGEIGPWGYCSEIFYDLQEGSGDFEEGDRYLEIWNLVFMQFCFDGKENFELDFPCIDTGMGLERITSVLEGKTDNYEISFFKGALKFLGEEQHNPHTKIFLDHLRSTSALIMEGIVPGPSQEGYVLRRLIRRMLKSFFTFQVNFGDSIKNIYEYWSNIYQFDFQKTLSIFEKEKKAFQTTIDEALKIFDELYEKNKEISADDIFLLHDRYGLTVDITYDLVRERGGSGDFAGFEQKMEEAKKKNSKEKLELDFATTLFLEEYEAKGKIIGIKDQYLILDQTIFYGEGGGQVGDTGEIFSNNFKAKILDTKKFNKVYCHEFELISGKINIGEEVNLKIDKNRRKKIEAHHSCSHLLQYVLEKLYGSSIKQMGSYVSEFKLREDFSFPEEEINIKKIEEEINAIIKSEIETKYFYTSLSEARKMGAKAFFEYEDQVRVVQVGDSLELCGGTHVANTKDIIKCKITKISSIKSGVKRFEAVAGYAYIEQMEQKLQIFESGLELLGCQLENYVTAIKKLKQVKIEPKIYYKSTIKNLNIGIIICGEEDKIEDLMDKNKLDLICLYIEKESKCSVKIKSSSIDAKQLIVHVSPLLEARGGGGNKEFAQTGGKKIENLDDLVLHIEQFLKK